MIRVEFWVGLGVGVRARVGLEVKGTLGVSRFLGVE